MKNQRSSRANLLSRPKTIRIILAGLFFISSTLVFLDLHHIVPRWISDSGLYFQFIPSLIHSTGSFGVASAGFLIILILTLFFGRIYCSSICPLGILMDIIGYMKKKLGKKTVHRYNNPNTGIRFLLLAASIWTYLAGSIFLLNVLDPFSNYGRISVAIFKPIIILGNNVVSFLFEEAGSYAIPPYPFSKISVHMLTVSLLIGGVIAMLAWKRGRLYCNMICPVGTLLGFCARYSLFKVRINHNNCNHCRKCETTCKSDCIDISNQIVDHSRCVSCFNCIDACPKGAVNYSSVIYNAPINKSAHENGVAIQSRRSFMAVLGASLVSLPEVGRCSKRIEITVPNKIVIPQLPHPIIPPGGVSLNHFTDRCTGCHACIASCPSHVLQPGITEYGLEGLFMPYLDPDAGFCNLNCNECSQACPTGALTPFSLQEKKQIQLGVVKFVRDNCIVVLQKTDCGACSEHCPTKAVTMATEGKVRVPVVDESTCIGCGACQHVCPAKPNKAIYIKPHTVHQIAEIPVSKKANNSETIKDFPF